MNVISERLKQLREKFNYSQVSLEGFTGMKQRTLSQWEQGKPPEAFEWLKGLARRYEVSSDYILGLTNDPTQAGEPSEIQHLYDQLPEDRQQDLLDQADLWLLKKSGDYRRELVKRLMIEEEDKDLADQLKILLDEDEPEDEE